MNLTINLKDPKYCGKCPYSKGVCGCSKYLNEDGNNTNCGCTPEGKPYRLQKCIEENGEWLKHAKVMLKQLKSL